MLPTLMDRLQLEDSLVGSGFEYRPVLVLAAGPGSNALLVEIPSRDACQRFMALNRDYAELWFEKAAILG